MITNADLIREIRKPGKVSVPVLQVDGVERIIAEKSDLIAYLAGLEPDGCANWCFVSETDGVRNLDIQN